MIEDFCKSKLNVLLTKDDIPHLRTFQDELSKASGRVVTWASGHSIDSELTRRYIRNYDGHLMINCLNGKIYVAPLSDYVLLPELLGMRDYEVKESDILNLLE